MREFAQWLMGMLQKIEARRMAGRQV